MKLNPDMNLSSLTLAKPNADFFEMVIKNARFLHTDLEPAEILHIGDNFECDYTGATNAGIQCLLIDSPETLTKNVLDFYPELILNVAS
jgi:FMN phosphatase YigB (HAD superfamily)